MITIAKPGGKSTCQQPKIEGNINNGDCIAHAKPPSLLFGITHTLLISSIAKLKQSEWIVVHL